MKKLKSNKIQKRSNHKIVICVITVLTVCFLSIGFSAFQNNLYIDGIKATVRIDKDVRIMNFKINKVNNAVSLYEDYNINNVTSEINLLSSDSYIIYDVDIYNLGNVIMGIKDITINDDNLKLEVLDYNLKDKLCSDNICTLGVKKTIRLKISYKDNKYNPENTTYKIRADFDFRQLHNISYKNVEHSNLQTEIIDGDTLSIKIQNPSKPILKVFMDGNRLSSDKYTYTNGVLTVPNVTGDIIVAFYDSSIMREIIVKSYVSSGEESDLPSINPDEMTNDERKNTFGNIDTNPGLYTTTGIKGSFDALVFRGNVKNNYVRFAGNTWRILEIDEDGNLRLILEDPIVQGTHYRETSTITDEENAKTVLEYKNSLAQEKLNDWYKYLNNWDNKILKSNFCNDFNHITATSSGSSNKVYYYKSYQKVGADSNLYIPSLVCSSDSIFQEKIGLISAEEYVLAGGSFGKANTNFFLYNEKYKNNYWTLSPSFYDLVRGNGNVFSINETGTLTDYSSSLLKSYNFLRPVITIDGSVKMEGNGTINNQYRYSGMVTATSKDIIDLSTLENGSWYIGSTTSSRSVYGIMSNKVSTTLSNVQGLLGKNTAYFNERLNTITNIDGITFKFVNGKTENNEQYYQIQTKDNLYLKINDDKSIELTSDPTYCKVSFPNTETKTGEILIMNESGTMYLNYYGAASKEGDDKFAGWNEEDKNAYIKMFKLDFE